MKERKNGKKLEILFLWNSVYSLPTDGSGAYSHNYFLRNGFRKLGHKVSTLEINRNDIKTEQKLYDKLRALLPRTITDWLRDLYTLLFDFRFSEMIKERVNVGRPDFIYERFTWYRTSGCKTARKLGIPYIVEVHGPPEGRSFTQRLNFHRLNKQALKYVTKGADSVVVVSSSLREYLIGLGTDEERIIVLPNAVDPQVFGEFGKRDKIRSQLKINDEIIVGFVGTMKNYHGIDLCPLLCQIVKKEIPNIKFLLVGSFGSEKNLNTFKNLLRANHVEEYFLLVGGIPLLQVPGYIEAMDICLVPDSNRFGSPIKLFEYGALSKPTVSPSYGPIEEIIKDGVNGLLFEPYKITDMAKKVIKLAKNKDLARRLGYQLYQDILNNHTWTENAQRIMDAISLS